MKHIVILGAGFGGLQTALTLSKQLTRHRLNGEYSVILVDKNSFHTFTPLLYEVAATSPETASDLELQSIVTFPFEKLVGKRNIVFVQDEFVTLDPDRKVVTLSRSSIEFIYLVVALGSEVHYFDVPGLGEYALPLKTFDDAIRIRDRIVSTFRSSERNVRIVIGGGGPTGVELASEIRQWIPELEKECNRTNCGAEVTIVEGAARVLAALDKRISAQAMQRLHDLGISVLLNTRIIHAEERKIYLSSEISKEYDIFIWTGGVKANSATDQIPFKKGGRGRIETDANTIPNDSKHDFVFAIGDNASPYHPLSHAPTPLMARPAIIEGRVAAENIISKITGKKKMCRYQFRNYPYIIPLGGKYAIARVGKVVLSGFPAWIFKGFTELNYFLSIMPPWTAIGVWLKGFLIFIKNDRLG